MVRFIFFFLRYLSLDGKPILQPSDCFTRQRKQQQSQKEKPIRKSNCIFHWHKRKKTKAKCILIYLDLFIHSFTHLLRHLSLALLWFHSRHLDRRAEKTSAQKEFWQSKVGCLSTSVDLCSQNMFAQNLKLHTQNKCTKMMPKKSSKSHICEDNCVIAFQCFTLADLNRQTQIFITHSNCVFEHTNVNTCL